ncbi:septum formation family protein [Rathayibacter festucae]|uniref:septum formation family protein n=1 Tax=Rathayibacter TaxID=33886 RepID=UPI000F4705FD|nr:MULTISPECIES: septum formation family protein [Rathayibacter]MCJ1700987.1 septum formation family protein [Rathayibacter festucae]ROQ02179.1 putative regulator of septum formation [Rathayibacter sp. PhB93]ROQ54549.1 putative regulator of septum formation [Rathayibacter sp. PhB152]TDQ07748.1 putative regulator of septum formation [Rathayibacter sp. PhB1]
MSRRSALLAAALLTAVLPLAACSSVVGSDDPAALRDEGGTVTTAGVVDAFSVAKGDCLREPDDDRVADFEAVPCADSHDLEVFHVFAQPGDDYTSRNTLLAQADAGCEPEFGAVMGIAYGDSALEYRSFVPSEVSWRHGDRAVLCAVFDPATGETTGSLFGAAR